MLALDAQVREVHLLDGMPATVRALRPSDHDAIEDMFDSASDENLYRRFFGVARSLAHGFVDGVCLEDGRHLALVVEADGRIVGVFDAEETADDTADVSLFVADDFHRHGVGTVMLAAAVDELRARGVRSLTADVLTLNAPMLHVFARAGLGIVMHRDGSVVEVAMTLD